MAVTTDISSILAYRDRVVLGSSSLGSTTLTTEGEFPGFRCCTIADTIVRFPLQYSGGKVVLMGFFATATTVNNIQFDIAYGNNTTDPAWGGRNVVYSSSVPSTKNAAWVSYASTAVTGGTATESAFYTLGPIDTAKFAMNFGGASSAIQDKYENFIYVMAGACTGLTGPVAHAVLSTSAAIAAHKWIAMLEIPS